MFLLLLLRRQTQPRSIDQNGPASTWVSVRDNETASPSLPLNTQQDDTDTGGLSLLVYGNGPDWKNCITTRTCFDGYISIDCPPPQASLAPFTSHREGRTTSNPEVGMPHLAFSYLLSLCVLRLTPDSSSCCGRRKTKPFSFFFPN